MFEGAALRELHDKEGVAPFTDIANGADVGMIESGSGIGFAAKTLED
jgi:hypothetical protein